MKKPVVKLTGQDGNVFNIIGLCCRALRREVSEECANEFATKAFNAGSYDEVLQLAMKYCEVQ